MCIFSDYRMGGLQKMLSFKKRFFTKYTKFLSNIFTYTQNTITNYLFVFYKYTKLLSKKNRDIIHTYTQNTT